MISRRRLITAAVALGVTGIGAGVWMKSRKKPIPIGFDVEPAQLARAVKFLESHPAFDTHAHPGRTFVRGATGLSPKLKLYKALGSFEKRVVTDMKAGHIAGGAFATVSDFDVLDIGKKGLFARREFAPGEAWNSFLIQMGNMQALGKTGLVQPLYEPEQLQEAFQAGKVGAWFTAEGGDFLEGKAERVEKAYSMGLRSITLLHYRNNALGDAMTSEPAKHGLTPAGREVVQEMDKYGMVIDTAHSSEATVRGILAATSNPVMCSHTHILSDHVPKVPRFITPELAKEIVAGGGIIGAWPAGFGITTLQGYVGRFTDLIAQVGVDHVCLGTDMDANYKPVMDNYRQMPTLVVGLWEAGLNDEEIAKVLGGNFLRVWKQVSMNVSKTTDQA